ncbi:hypothetical protein ACOSQ3_010589 [Xanthoceras sorbifolium]
MESVDKEDTMHPSNKDGPYGPWLLVSYNKNGRRNTDGRYSRRYNGLGGNMGNFGSAGSSGVFGSRAHGSFDTSNDVGKGTSGDQVYTGLKNKEVLAEISNIVRRKPKLEACKNGSKGRDGSEDVGTVRGAIKDKRKGAFLQEEDDDDMEDSSVLM